MAGQPSILTALPVRGMTCSSCEMAVERAVAGVSGVHSAEASRTTGVVTIRSSETVDKLAVERALVEIGYGISDNAEQRVPRLGRYAQAAAALVIVLGLWIAAQKFGGFRGVDVPDNVTLGFVFAIGLLASVSSCIAVTGGLLVALAAKFNETTVGRSQADRFIPHLYFNGGRVLS